MNRSPKYIQFSFAFFLISFFSLEISGQGAPITSVNASYSAASSPDFNYTINGAPTGSDYDSGTSYTCYFGHSGASGNNNYTISTTNSFVASGNTFQHFAQSDVFNIRRVDNAFATGIKDVIWVEELLPNSGTTINHRPDYFTGNQTLMNSLFLNVGTDETFVNDGAKHFSNIERFDYVFTSGLKTHEPDNSGFAIFERSGSNDVYIAAVTSIDGSGNATGYGPLTIVGTSQYGPSLFSPDYTIFSKLQSDAFFRPSEDSSPQNIEGIYISFSDLGVNSGQVIYGYVLMPEDVTAGNYTDYTLYPTNTTTGDSGGDFAPGGAVYCWDGNLLSGTAEICGNAVDDNLDGRTDEELPGGAADNLLLWLKADAGFSATTWTDQGPFGNDATVYGDPVAVSNSLNFNPGINFDGNDHVEVDLPELVFQNGNEHMAIFTVYQPSTSSTSIGVFGNQAGSMLNIQLANGNYGRGNGDLNIPQAYGTSPHLVSYIIDEEDNVGGAASSSSIYHNGNLHANFTFDEISSSNVDTQFHVGISGSNASSPYYQGDIQEIIIYYENNGNEAISSDQRIEIESYLALKYGISLGHNYSDSQ